MRGYLLEDLRPHRSELVDAVKHLQEAREPGASVSWLPFANRRVAERRNYHLGAPPGARERRSGKDRRR